MLSITTIDAIKELPIEQVLSRYVDLKPSGQHLKGCCPLHGEKTPSFMVSKVKNNWHCYGCNEGGDAIQFVILHKTLSFIDACKKIASDHGIAIEEKQVKGKTPEQIDQEELMFRLLQIAQQTYKKSLTRDVVRYLVEERKLSRKTIIAWHLGLCPEWDVMRKQVIELGQFEPAEKAGLVRKSDQGGYDYFHHRITIPIHDRRGMVIGFGGRKISGDGPKYLNSPETALYKKNKVLFGFDKAVKNFKKHGMAVLVEGYFDVLKLHDRGWDNTVASCGTALTEEHAKLLKRHTETVLIMRDGDAAGINAMEKDIPILAAAGLNVLVIALPEKDDPDTLFDNVAKARDVLWQYNDGIEYLCSKYMVEGEFSTAAMASAIGKVVRILALIQNQSAVELYIKTLSKKFGLKPADLSKPLTKHLDALRQEREAAAAAAEENDDSQMPAWVDKKMLDEQGFVQLAEPTKGGWRPGIYFRSGNGLGNSIFRTTNFVLRPLYHIYEQSNNRRMVEVDNHMRSAVVELPNQALVNQSSFEAELLGKGNFVTDFLFTKKEFKRIQAWLSNMPIAYELKTLGWQPEGFFAFSDAVFADGQLQQYDEMGMVRVADKLFLSLGKSKIHKDERQTDNPYENDLYLSYKESPIDFQKWAQLFNDTYGDNAPYGIAYVFMTLFKDLFTKVSKMPILYCYGPKGAGKSAMAESITWLFFSGKNGEHDLIKGFNLNPGQGTPFSFFNRIERFRNCPILMNEFDENNIEDWKFGTFKAAYDGEGREVGDGDSGKKRKTRIQKVQGTILLVGQYLSTRDDGSVLSRSLSCLFKLERLSNLTAEQKKAHDDLKAAEQKGLSGLLTDLLKYRDDVAKKLPGIFEQVRASLVEDTRKAGQRIEERLINNYSLVLAASKMIGDIIKLPYTYDDFYLQARSQVIALNKMLKNNSALHQFWKGVEILFDIGAIKNNYDLQIKHSQYSVRLKDGSLTRAYSFEDGPKSLLYVRFSNIYSQYSKHHRERTGKPALAEDTLLLYMQEQPYYIGLCPSVYFKDKITSAFVFDYDKMQEFGIVLEKRDQEENDPTPPAPASADLKQATTDKSVQLTLPKNNDDLPF